MNSESTFEVPDESFELSGLIRYNAAVLWFEDGVYRGESEQFGSNRLKHGLGVFLGTDRSVYEGFWFKDRKHGKGLEIQANKDKYFGDFVHGKF